MESNMKYFLLLVLLVGQIAWPQIKTGTVMYADFSQDEITISADSRMNIPETGGHDDTECKISAFGDKFAFAMAGAVKSSGESGWNGHTIARKIWQSESTKTDAAKLVISVSDRWVTAMEDVYRAPEVIRKLRKHMPDSGTIANGIFIATDTSGNLIVRAMNIWLDLPLFDLTGFVHLLHSGDFLSVGHSLGAGLDEVVDEFQEQSSARAKEYIEWFRTQLASMTPSQRRATVATKFIELSTLLHPRNSEMGFPIDVLQLRKTTGIH